MQTDNAPVYDNLSMEEIYYNYEKNLKTIAFNFGLIDNIRTISMSLHSFGLLFNILTLIVISRFKAKSRSYKLMAVLAAADIGSSLGSFLSYFKLILSPSKAKTRFTMCLIYTIYTESMIAFGTYVYLMLTIDRFVALVKGIEYRNIMTKNKYLIYTGFLLTHHILILFVSYKFFPNDDYSVYFWPCTSAHLIHPYANYYMLGFITLLALITTGLCITLVIYLIVKQFKRKSLDQGGSGSRNLTKATTTLIMVCTIYAGLYIQLVLIQVLTTGTDSWEMIRVREASDYVFMVNHFINPLIYYIRMPELRKEFHAFLFCRSHR